MNLPDGFTIRYTHLRRTTAPQADVLYTRVSIAGTWYPMMTAATARACGARVLPRGGRTIAQIVSPTGYEAARGIATCSVQDNFNRATGRALALDRALEDIISRVLVHNITESGRGSDTGEDFIEPEDREDDTAVAIG